MEIRDSEELKSIVLRNIESAKSNAEEVGSQRKKAYQYYYMKPLGNEREGRSQHVSPDVMQAVDYIKYMIMDAFTSNRDLVRFEPENEGDIEAAEQATQYVNHVMHKQNDGYKVIYDAVHDGLLLKNGIIKRYWKKDQSISKEQFEGLSEPQFNQLLSRPDIELVTLEESMIEVPVPDGMGNVIGVQQSPIFSGEVEVIKDTSRIAIESVPPEEFLISANATSLEDADFVAHYRKVQKAELLSMGYDPEKVEKVGSERHINQNNEALSRNAFDSTSTLGAVSHDADGREYVTLYESYIKVDVSGTGRIEIYKMDIANDILLDIEEVTEYPFEYWSALPIPHKFNGMSIADIVIPTQYTNSQIKRALTDYTLLTANPRYQTNLAMVNNARDLIDNRIGATISVNDVNQSIRPLDIPQISPGLFTLPEMLEQDKERVTGLSRMAQGVDSSAFSAQNHRDTIKEMTKAGSIKPSGIARNFAEMCLKKLMAAIYRLAMENETQEKIMRINGKYVPVNPGQWKERTQLSVSVALTGDDGMKRAQQMLGIAGQMRNDPMASQLFGEGQTYAMYKDIMEEAGIISPYYLENPNTTEFQQKKQQQAMAQQKAQQEQMAMTQAQLQLADKQITLTSQTNQAKMQLDKYKHDDKMGLEREKQDQVELMDTHERRMDYDNQ